MTFENSLACNDKHSIENVQRPNDKRPICAAKPLITKTTKRFRTVMILLNRDPPSGMNR